MSLARLQDRLLSDNAVAFHLAPGKTGIGDKPMAPEQLDGVFALILDRNAICEHIMILARTGIRWLVFRLHTYLNPLRNFRYHTTKNINFFEFGHPARSLVAIPAEIPFFVRLTGSFGQKIPENPAKLGIYPLHASIYERKNCAGLEATAE